MLKTFFSPLTQLFGQCWNVKLAAAFLFLSGASFPGTSCRFIAILRHDEDKSFVRPCKRGQKQAPGFASTKALGGKKGDTNAGMTKKGSFAFLHLASP